MTTQVGVCIEVDTPTWDFIADRFSKKLLVTANHTSRLVARHGTFLTIQVGSTKSGGVCGVLLVCSTVEEV